MARFAGRVGLSRSSLLGRPSGEFLFHEVHPDFGGGDPGVGFYIRVQGLCQPFRGAVDACDLWAERAAGGGIAIRCRPSFGLLHRPSRDVQRAVHAAMLTWLNQVPGVCWGATLTVEVHQFLVRLPGEKASSLRGWWNVLRAGGLPSGDAKRALEIQRQFRERAQAS
jgi:hypothetical protein